MKKLLYILFLFLLSACVNSKPITKDNVKEQNIDISVIKDNFDSKLHYLDLSNKKLDNIPDICSVLTWNLRYNIWSIDFSLNNIKEIDQDLSCMPNIKDINLSYNRTEKFITLWKLPILQDLKLHKNNIKDLKNIWKYKSLVKLNLAYNWIKNISWLLALKNLQFLQLQHNNITNLLGIENLLKLKSIKLEFNNISDKDQLKYLKKLKNLKNISIAQNPLDQSIIDKLNKWSSWK